MKFEYYFDWQQKKKILQNFGKKNEKKKQKQGWIFWSLHRVA